MKLYSYWRSSASYRVRIALALKRLKADIVPVNLLKSEQKDDSYASVNPQKRVPALIDAGHTLTQSLAIMEYLEEVHPLPSLLPLTPPERAYVRAVAQAVACDISPVNNIGTQRYLKEQMGCGDEGILRWQRHWITAGFTAVEAMLAASPYIASFCHGSVPTMADCCLIPQVYNARRIHVDMTPFPIINRIDIACARLPAFITAHPAQQKDAIC